MELLDGRVSALGGGGQGGVGDAYMHWRLRHTSVQILKEENTDVIVKYIVKIRPFYFNPLFTMLTTLKRAGGGGIKNKIK